MPEGIRRGVVRKFPFFLIGLSGFLYFPEWRGEPRTPFAEIKNNPGNPTCQIGAGDIL
ncbi:MAG: hypothetical protein OXC82_13295 [Rhodobacteraceae bacterium]|nr:hypothetical protein [Paracoccaceae bacterium]